MGVFLKQRPKILLGLIVIAAVSVAGANHHAVVIHKPWIQEAPPSAEVLAAYMILKNTSRLLWKTHKPNETVLNVKSNGFLLVGPGKPIK